MSVFLMFAGINFVIFLFFLATGIHNSPPVCAIPSGILTIMFLVLYQLS